MKIKRAVQSNSIDVAKVQVNSWKTTYRNIIPNEVLSEMTYESRIDRWETIIATQAVYIAQTEKGEIVGFSNGGIERTGNYPDYRGEIYAVYIVESFQRKGIGKLLLKPLIELFIEKRIYSIIVRVLEENSSRYFYESLGAVKMDARDIEFSGIIYKELVYGWDDIRRINLLSIR